MMPADKTVKAANIIETEGVGKEFNGVWVLKDIDFSLRPGEIHSLVGENGAGKSTFIKILSGVYQPSSGSIKIDGSPITFHNVRHSESFGIRTVHQEINLVPFFNVYENIFIGTEQKKNILGIGVLDDRQMKKKAKEVIDKLGVRLDVNKPAHLLNASMQRIVEISKVLVHSPRVIIFDEPTTSLGEEERKRLLEIIKGLKKTGIGIIYISHNLEEVMEISDRITVFRDGCRIDTMDRSEAAPEKIVSMMIGHKSYNEYKREECYKCSEVFIDVKNLSTDKLKGINFSVHKGEILGIAGVVGAGKTEIAKAIFGLDKIQKGEIQLYGGRYQPSCQRAIENGIALVPEERQAQGLIPNYSVMKNITLTYLNKWCSRGVMDSDREIETAREYIDLMSIKTTGYAQLVKFLSGGNQQKVILSRWLNGDFKIGLFDEPTKGIDVKAKEDIYGLMDQLAREGKAIIVLSSYLPELLSISDRIIVVHEGELVGEFDPKEDNAKEKIMHAMLGGRVA
ncbi:MAG: sugar ABC transporter ATP-binding protein [Bacillota bacterium]|nr:sugar ABC transporter ATP-binding protein [Bacillota bacterium]